MSLPSFLQLPVADVKAWITTERIGAESVLPLVADDRYGAAIIFLGTVRNHNEGRAVTGVLYEGYHEMAERTLRDIVSEAAARIEPASIAVVHRLGELGIGEVSIAIAVATPHRSQAFDACRYVIEQVKLRLAVWKQERYREGEREWLAGSMPPVPETAR